MLDMIKKYFFSLVVLLHYAGMYGSLISPLAKNLDVPAFRNTTLNVISSGFYNFIDSGEFNPLSTASSVPMVRVTSVGTTINLGGNNISMDISDPANAFGVAFEIGYTPNALGSNVQPHSVVIENGVLSNWTIGILVHAGVRHVTFRNMIFVDNVIPVIALGQNSAPSVLEKEVVNITFENVQIIGSNSDKLLRLNWIKSYLTDGTSVGSGVDAVAAGISCGYVQGEVMPRENDPIAGTTATLEVYAGVYLYGVSDINFKNVFVSTIGFNGTPLTSYTGAYGIWNRNCRSITMSDVEVKQVQSAVVAVGVYMDDCDLVSFDHVNVNQCSTVQVVAAGVFAATPEQLWAAAIVLSDCNFVSLNNGTISKNSAINNVWGIRCKYIQNTYMESFALRNYVIDGLRADRVYGCDLGDLYRNNGVSRLFARSVQHGVIQGMSISAAQGKNAETSVATEFKGIYLGDGSSSMMVGNIFIENNAIAAAATGQNSAIEFGASSITVGATSTISGLVLNELAIRNNGTSITTDANKFCGIRGVTGGSTNLFKDIKFTNSYVQSNSGDGVRFADSAGTVGGTVEIMNMSNVLLDRNNSAIRVGSLTRSNLLNSSFSKSTGSGAALNITSAASTIGIHECIITDNAAGGISVVGAAQNCTINKSLIYENGGSGIVFQSTLTDAVINESLINSNNGFGISVLGVIAGSFFKKSHFDRNADAGISLASSSNNFVLDSCSFNGNVNYGFYTPAVTTSLVMRNVQACNTTGVAAVYGIYIGTGNSLQLNSLQCNENSSSGGNVAGLYIGSTSKATIKNVEARGNTTTNGIAQGCGFSVMLHVTMVNVDASRNVGTTGAYGIYVSLDAISFQADRIIANYNTADRDSSTSAAAGIYFLTALQSGSFKNISANSNVAGGQAYGIYLAGLLGVTLEDVQAVENRSFFSNNVAGFYIGAGIYLESGDSVKLNRFRADSNSQDQMESEFTYTNSFMLTLENDLNSTNQLVHHFSVRNKAGAYGVYANGINNLVIENGSALSNSGVRGYGVHVELSDYVKINSVNASENNGRGGVWANNDNPFFDNSSFKVPENQDQFACLFGYEFGSNSIININQAYQYLLASLDEYATFVTTQTTCNALCLLSKQTIASMYRIIWSTLAQFRRFSTGVGISVLNCNNAQVNSCRAVGNSSENDSAVGIALYATNQSIEICTSIGQCSCSGEGSSVSNCIAEGNDAWTVSRRGGFLYAINGSIDITEWLPLYTFLGVQTYDGTGTYNVQPIATLPGPNIPSGSPINGITPPGATFTMNVPLTSGNVFSWTLSPRKMAVGFTPTTSTTLFDFSAPLPIAAGIVIESITDCYVNDNTASLSKGNVGVGFGILADGTLSSMFIDNKVTHNSADALGQAWGIADMELTTPNVWYRNFLMANRVDTFLNYSYLVIFDPAIVIGQSFPLTIVYPGDVSALNNQLSYDNIEVYFKTNRQISSAVSEFMAQGWNTAIPTGYGLMS